jgi:hypothetical protein
VSNSGYVRTSVRKLLFNILKSISHRLRGADFVPQQISTQVNCGVKELSLGATKYNDISHFQRISFLERLKFSLESIFHFHLIGVSDFFRDAMKKLGGIEAVVAFFASSLVV